MVEGMQDSQLLVQPGGGSGDNNSNNNSNNSGGAAAAAAAAGSGASQRGQRGQRKDRPIFPGQHEEARANDDTQRRGGELVGVVGANESAAAAAASLGWTTNRPPEPWRPRQSASSSTAAFLAKDYKMASTWEPVSSSDGAKAALLAAQNTKNTDPWRPSVTSYGHSAANLAFKSDRSTSQSPQLGSLERQGSLRAARGAMVGRKRAISTPVMQESYPDEVNAASNALAAAARAHSQTQPPNPSEDTGAIPYTMMNRLMFTSRPPVTPEVEEQKKADVLHASAVAMAKKMYNQQQKMIDAKKQSIEAASAQGSPSSLDNMSDDAQPMPFMSLQDAAYKQAQERLAKLHVDNLKNREFQDYYGAGHVQRRFTIRNKLRKRASSDSDMVDDRARSQQIRQQMSIFTNKLSEVDDKKRQQDRDALLILAHRNVQARLKSMDEKITAETGMVPPSTLTQWELKAHAAAQTRSEARTDKSDGKIDVGAGLRIDRETVDAIAARRVQPVLDEINEKAEDEHARRTQLKLEMERKKEEEERDKVRQKEVHGISKKLKEQDKQAQKERKEQEKLEAKAKHEQQKAEKAELKRLSKAEKHRDLSDHARDGHEESTASREIVVLNSNNQPVSIRRPVTPTAPEVSVDAQEEGADETSKSPRGRKVKTWLRSHFSRTSRSEEERPDKRSFVGGATLAGRESSTSLSDRSASMRDVAMAGRDRGDRDSRSVPGLRHSPLGAGRPEHEVSPMSSSSSEEDFFGGSRDHRSSSAMTGLSPPSRIRDPSIRKSQSPARDSRFREMM